jgi:hypothetical protein
MDTLKSLTARKQFLPVVAAIGGIILGILYAWVINPVEFVDGVPSQLRDDLQRDYLRMAIDSYSVNSDAELALDRYQTLGETASQTLNAIAVDPGEVSPNDVQKFRALIEIEAEVSPEAEAEPESTSAVPNTNLILPVCGATLLIGLLLAVALVLRGRLASRADEGEDAFYAEDLIDEAEPTAETPVAVDTGESLATFRTIYSIGDDLYDDSFSIESPAGDFLGECGVGIGDVIGVGDPKKVSAFEIWLFDKNDIQTVTKVVLSGYAFNDEETRNRLAAKGDPVLAEAGGTVSLSTASLEVEARVVDMTYGEGPLPPESFFDRFTIELRAWPRQSP